MSYKFFEANIFSNLYFYDNFYDIYDSAKSTYFTWLKR